MPPQPLQIGSAWENGSPKFVQQGQVDWVAFGNTVWSASAAVLQRFASSGIQPMTFGAGLALASQFRMSDGGRQRMDQAMQSLRGVPGFGKILWFGFGYQSFVRMMGESQLGINTVALCSCLTEVHSEELAARVLAELWQVNGFPEEHEPSYSQFLALVKACSGVVTSRVFNSALDRMTGCGRWSYERNQIQFYGMPMVQQASNASDIARALHGLFQITRGKVERITLLGQHDCAFIAAFASWLFDLKIFIEDDVGSVIFASQETLRKADAQLVVTYTTEDQPTALQQSTTYILSGGADLLTNRCFDPESHWIHRIPWDGCLLRTFGSTFRALSGLAHTLGSFLGGTARIYAALARGEPNVADFARARFIGFSQSSYGHGFVHSVTYTFKELERVASLRITMERVLGSTFDSAYREVEQAAQSLRSSCHCSLCSDNPSPDADSTWGDCYFALALAIRNLVADMSCTVRDDALLVAMYGLQLYYANNHADYRDWLQNEHQRTLVGVAVGLASVTDSREVRVPKSETLLQDVRSLFDGSPGQHEYQEPERIVADARSGICCYRESLHGIKSEAGAMRTIHVVPGHIERGTAQYDVVDDLEFGDKVPAIAEPVTLTKAETAIPKHEPIRLGEFKIKALARESSEYRRLHFGYKVLLPNGSIAQIQPGRFSNRVLEKTGILTCYHSKKCKQNLAFPCSAVLKGWAVDDSTQRLLHYNSGLALCLWSHSEDIARCVASQLHGLTYLRRDECLPCCTESVLRETAARADNWRNVVHII
ncbi:MAG: hypothetical protein Q9172_003477 [Xanthocarpia lactea]